MLLAVLATALTLNWEEFKAEYNKSYSSESEEALRREIFEKNLQFVKAHDAAATGYTVAINRFGDLTAEEFARATAQTPREGPVYQGPPILPAMEALPPSRDWRASGCVGPVQNQGQCGAVWAITARNLIQTYNCLKHSHRLVSLSLQDILDCTPGSQGCNGGLVDYAMQYCAQQGIDTEASYPSTGRQGSCRHSNATVGAKCHSWHRVTPPGNETALTELLAYTGPAACAINAGQTSFQLYSGGVYSDPACTAATLNHMVLTVGYGDLNGQSYYILQNSWGAAWGMQGYMLLARNKGNLCGIASDALWVTVE